MHVFGQVFGHALGQGGDQRAQAALRHAAHLIQQVIHLHLHGADFDLRIDKARGADHLFGKDAARLLQLPRRRGGRDEDRLRAHRIPFLELQRAVVHAGRQAEPVFGQGELAPVVALVHAADLRDRDMGFIGKNDGIVGDEFEQGWRRFPRRAPGQIARIVLDPVADAGCFQHFQIKGRALFQPLGLQQLALVHQLVQPEAQLALDPLDRLLHRRARRDVMAVGIDADLFERIGFRARQRIEFDDGFKVIAKEGKPPGPVFQVGRPHFQTVAAHPETAALKRLIVAAVLLRHQFRHHLADVIALPHQQILRHRRIGFDRSDAIDAGDRGDDDHIIPFQQRPRGRMAHPVDLFVDLAFLLDIGVRPGHIGLGLIIVVIADKVFHGVLGKKPFEFAV